MQGEWLEEATLVPQVALDGRDSDDGHQLGAAVGEAIRDHGDHPALRNIGDGDPIRGGLDLVEHPAIRGVEDGLAERRIAIKLEAHGDGARAHIRRLDVAGARVAPGIQPRVSRCVSASIDPRVQSAVDDSSRVDCRAGVETAGFFACGQGNKDQCQAAHHGWKSNMANEAPPIVWCITSDRRAHALAGRCSRAASSSWLASESTRPAPSARSTAWRPRS